MNVLFIISHCGVQLKKSVKAKDPTRSFNILASRTTWYFDNYRMGTRQRTFWWACATAQTRQNTRCSNTRTWETEKKEEKIRLQIETSSVNALFKKTFDSIITRCWSMYRPRREKPRFCCMRTIKTQTSLRIRADWPAPFVFPFWKVQYLNLSRAKFQDSS